MWSSLRFFIFSSLLPPKFNTSDEQKKTRWIQLTVRNSKQLLNVFARRFCFFWYIHCHVIKFLKHQKKKRKRKTLFSGNRWCQWVILFVKIICCKIKMTEKKGKKKKKAKKGSSKIKSKKKKKKKICSIFCLLFCMDATNSLAENRATGSESICRVWNSIVSIADGLSSSQCFWLQLKKKKYSIKINAIFFFFSITLFTDANTLNKIVFYNKNSSKKVECNWRKKSSIFVSPFPSFNFFFKRLMYYQSFSQKSVKCHYSFLIFFYTSLFAVTH